MTKPTPEEIAEKRRQLEEAQAAEEALREQAVRHRRRFYGLQVEPEVSYYDDAPRREPGEGNWVGYGFDLHPQVSMMTAVILVLFVGWTLANQATANEVFSAALASISTYFGWLYILSANIIVLAMAGFAFGPYGRVRIGGPDARPEFSDFGWYSMLISAGMGIGLMFWSIAEPLMHYASPSPMFGVAGRTPEAAQAAFAVTYYHWGLHPWGLYALVGLALAFFAFNRGLPLTIRSVFYPLLGERIHGWWGNMIDTLSVLATLCGLATSLGLGVKQVAAGLDFLFPLPAAIQELPLAGTRTEGAPGYVTLQKTAKVTLPGVDGEPRVIPLEPATEAPALATSEYFASEAGPSARVFDSFSGRLRAGEGGAVAELAVKPGDVVEGGQLLAKVGGVPLRAARDQKVREVLGKVGQDVAAGAVLLRFDELDEDREALAARWRALYRAWAAVARVSSPPEDDGVLPAQATSEPQPVEVAKAWRAHMATIEGGVDAIPSTWFLVFLIALITSFATMSVVAGLDEGVQRLSEINIYLAGGMMLFLLVAGPTVFILSSFAQNLGYYVQTLPRMSLWTEAFRDSSWQKGWTLFYWGWWISWSPFVGMFIARISKGRTVREFVLGVMLLPTMLSFLWMSTFGGTALYLQQEGTADLATAVSNDVATALFEMLRYLPWTQAASLLGICLVTFFFVTSSDSGSLVVDHLTSGGKLDSPVPQRVFWAITEGALAAVLLLGGGLAALQTASIATGLPFALVLLVMIYSLYKDLGEELFQLEAAEARRAAERHEALALVAVDRHHAVVEERKAAEVELEAALEAYDGEPPP